MIGHEDGYVLNDDSERPGRGSRTPAVRARSSSSQPVAVGSAAGRRPGWAPARQGWNIGRSDSKHGRGASRLDSLSPRRPEAGATVTVRPEPTRPGPRPSIVRAPPRWHRDGGGGPSTEARQRRRRGGRRAPPRWRWRSGPPHAAARGTEPRAGPGFSAGAAARGSRRCPRTAGLRRRALGPGAHPGHRTTARRRRCPGGPGWPGPDPRHRRGGVARARSSPGRSPHGLEPTPLRPGPPAPRQAQRRSSLSHDSDVRLGRGRSSGAARGGGAARLHSVDSALRRGGVSAGSAPVGERRLRVNARVPATQAPPLNPSQY